MPRFKDQAICIRLIDWSETSQIVALLTPTRGKVHGLAKGSKRLSPGSVARYSGGIELLERGEIGGIIKPSSDLATLTEWDLQDPYYHLRTDLDAQRLACYAADLCNAILAEHDTHPRAFEEMAFYLSALAEPAARDLALLRFQWRLLEDCGYKPELEQDVLAGGELPRGRAHYSFDAQAGGFTVTAAGETGDHRGPGPWRARRETLELLRRVAGSTDISDLGFGIWDLKKDVGVEPASVQRANRLLCVYARAILDRELPTMGFVLDRSGVPETGKGPG